MAEPEILPPSRRRERRARHRTRVHRLGAVVLSLVMLAAIVGTALVVTGVVEIPGGSSSVRTAPVHREDPSTTTRPKRTATTRRRALTPSDPLQLWIAGDSLAGSVGPSLGEMTAQTGVVQPQYDSRVSSGLLNPDFFDWPEHARSELASIEPDVVVFVIGTNDAVVWSDSLAASYRIRTEAMMRELAGPRHRPVYWVGPPVMRDADLEEGAQAVGLIAREAAKHVKGVTYVDAHTVFDDPLGRYQQSFDNDFGVRRVMRAGDGIHFSVDGADLLSRQIFRALDAEWNLTDQAVPDQPKEVRETQGSTQVPGTHRSVGATVDTGPTSTTRDPSTASSTTTSASSSTSTSTSSTSTTTVTTAPPGP